MDVAENLTNKERLGAATHIRAAFMSRVAIEMTKTGDKRVTLQVLLDILRARNLALKAFGYQVNENGLVPYVERVISEEKDALDASLLSKAVHGDKDAAIQLINEMVVDLKEHIHF
jgi:hypothetical protein